MDAFNLLLDYNGSLLHRKKVMFRITEDKEYSKQFMTNYRSVLIYFDIFKTLRMLHNCPLCDESVYADALHLLLDCKTQINFEDIL